MLVLTEVITKTKMPNHNTAESMTELEFPKWQKVSEESPAYQSHLAQERAFAVQAEGIESGFHKVFGREELRWLDAGGDEELPDILKNERQMAITKRKAEQAIPTIREGLARYLSNNGASKDALKSELEEYSKLSGTDVTVETLLSQPDEVIEGFVRYHVLVFEVNRKSFEAKLEELREQFIQKAKLAIAKGELPITEELLEHRVRPIRIAAFDYLNGGLEEVWGRYQAQGGMFGEPTILISEHSQDYEKTLTHEMFHALSGQTIIGRRLNYEADIDGLDIPSSEFHHQRIGHYITAQRIDTEPRFFWLNEAVTERVTMDFLGRETGSYHAERLLLQMVEDIMTARGVNNPHQLFVNAYFENYEPNESTRLSSWKKMNEQINQAFGVRGESYLTSLDKKVLRPNGLTRTIFQLRDWARKNGIPKVSERIQESIAEIDKLLDDLNSPDNPHSEAKNTFTNS